MKILYVLHNRSLDGSYLTWTNIVRSVCHDYDIVVICPEELKEIEEYKKLEKECNLKTYPMKVYVSFYSKPIFNIRNIHVFFKWCKNFIISIVPKLLFLKKIVKVVRSERPSIIHTNTGVVHEAFIVAKLINIPHIWHLREYQDRDWGFWIYPTKFIFKCMLHFSSVIAITNDICNYFNIKKNNTNQVVYDGVEYENNAYPISISKDCYFLSACTIAPNKGIRDIILAFSEFSKKHSTYKLYLAGYDNSNYAYEMKELVRELNLVNRVIFLGFQPKEQVRSLMRKAKALVVASYIEGFGLMTAEAAFNGTIVIGRNTGGTKEILDAIGGVLFDGDYRVLASKMELVSCMKLSDYQCVTEKAQRVAMNKYSIEHNVRQIKKMYTILMNDYYGNKTT